MLLFPSLKVVNFSKNNFTTAGSRRFRDSYLTLRELDLSFNNIAQNASEIFHNIPPSLQYLDLSSNSIRGTLPKEFPIEQMRFFLMANNNVSGPLPNFPDTSPKLEHVSLANNRLSGTIHDTFWKLADLSVLDLSGNKLSGGIPSSIGLTRLSTLRLSSNLLGKSIPDKLGRLKGKSFTDWCCRNQDTDYCYHKFDFVSYYFRRVRIFGFVIQRIYGNHSIRVRHVSGCCPFERER